MAGNAGVTGSPAPVDFWHPLVDATVLGVATESMLSFAKSGRPTLTIAIPTFRRPGLLCETVRSVVAQTDLAGVRLIVLDNDPTSAGHAQLLSDVPQIERLDFRYFRNFENVGLFGNWNACIAAAETEWVTVLNDDDLLDPDFVVVMRAVLAGDPAIDALVPSMREFDSRGAAATLDRSQPWREKIKNVMRFGLRDRLWIQPKHLFFRNVAGSSLGLIVRRAVFIAVGGYQRSEYPGGDYMLNLRLAAGYKFVKLRRVLTSVRLQAENVSANRDVMIALFRQNSEIQRLLLGSFAPRWWDHLTGLFLSEQIADWNRRWNVNISNDEVAQAVGRRIPATTGPLVQVMRFVLGVM